MLLKINNISKSYKGEQLFERVTLQVAKGQRIGLLGNNGSGKTTLLKIISGEIKPDNGTILRHAEMNYVQQHVDRDAKKSGGEQKKENLGQAMKEKDTFLLLDEPTTNLDEKSVRQLQESLVRRQEGYVIITHDRELLSRTCKTIWMIEDGEITVFDGTYEQFMSEKENKKLEQKRAYEKYEQTKRDLVHAIDKKDSQATRATKMPKNLTGSEARASASKPYYAKKQKKLAKSSKVLENRLNRLERVERPKNTYQIKMDIPNQAQLMDKPIIQVRSLNLSKGGKKLLHHANLVIRGGDKLAIVGANGVGKTTFMQEIMSQTNECIQIHPSVKFGYFSQNMAILNADQTMYENIASTSKQAEKTIRIVMDRLQLDAKDMTSPVKYLSGGQQVKVALAKVFMSDMNVLILDEPTNYLDIEAIESLEQLLSAYKGTLILVTHVRRFRDCIGVSEVVLERKEIQDRRVFLPDSEIIFESDQEELIRIDLEITALIGELSIKPSKAKENKLEELISKKNKIRR